MGRPASDLDDYLDWQQRLENQKASGLSIEDFCLQEDGDTKVCDSVRVVGDRLSRTICVVTDECYGDRVVLVYER